MTERDEEISTAMPKDLDALPRRGGFRLRGLEMTRLESFVDATFAFAVSLLVIAGQQVPRMIWMPYCAPSTTPSCSLSPF